MIRIADALPEPADEIRRFLIAERRDVIADQFRSLTISRWTYDPDVDAGYVYLSGQRPLNLVEKNVTGVCHGESIDIGDCDGTVVLDIDNFGRVTGVEFLNRKDIKQKMENLVSNEAI